MRGSNLKRINLALQGGGAHGAFTWGVLDALLESDEFKISCISGTSAGAMNAVVLADGYHRGGAERARQALDDFWFHIGQRSALSPMQRSIVDIFFNSYNLDNSPGYLFLDVLSRFYGPYDFNPLNLNPLRDILVDTINFDHARACRDIHLFISATNVRTGRVRVFHGHEVTADAVMASACLPFLYQAVEIDGEAYWDGGYMGNPSLFPLFKSKVGDILLVQINPIEREGTPKTAREILNRVNEITFNAALLKEFRAMEFVERLLESGRVDKEHYKKLRMHRIDATDAFEGLNASSKMNTDRDFLLHLKQMGRDCAWRWMKTDGKKVGKESTLKLRDHIDRVEIHMED